MKLSRQAVEKLRSIAEEGGENEVYATAILEAVLDDPEEGEPP